MYFWMLSDSVTGNNRLRGKGLLLRPGRETRPSVDRDGGLLWLLLQLGERRGTRVADVGLSRFPTFGRRKDNRYLDAFYRIHELDRIPFGNDFILYWESWGDGRGIPVEILPHRLRIIYYLEHTQ